MSSQRQRAGLPENHPDNPLQKQNRMEFPLCLCASVVASKKKPQRHRGTETI